MPGPLANGTTELFVRGAVSRTVLSDVRAWETVSEQVNGRFGAPET